MELITSIDIAMLSFFTKISHRFQRLIGRTNFFLAKIMVCIMTIVLMVFVIDFWFPLLHYRFSGATSAGMVVIAGLNLIFCLIDLNRCDFSEKNALNDERVNVFMFLNSLASRFVSLVWAIVYIILIIPSFFVGGLNIVDTILTKYVLAWVSFLYFISVNPLPPCRSKVQKWLEAFSASFKKLASAKADIIDSKNQ